MVEQCNVEDKPDLDIAMGPGAEIKSPPIWSPCSSREKILTTGIDPAVQVGVEFGALNGPIISRDYGDIRYVDYATTEILKEKHEKHPDRVANMVEVDYAIAVHAIEHVPNVLGWFRGIFEVMKPGGVFHFCWPSETLSVS